MEYFIILAIVVTLLLKRNPLSIVITLTLRVPYLLLGGFFLQIILYMITLTTQRIYPVLIELSLAAVIVCLWFNRRISGFSWILAGALLNFTAVVVHGGLMPVSLQAVKLSGLGRLSENEPRHQLMSHSDFWWLGDWIPFIKHVLSIGDIAIGAGLIWFMIGNSAKRRQHEA